MKSYHFKKSFILIGCSSVIFFLFQNFTVANNGNSTVGNNNSNGGSSLTSFYISGRSPVKQGCQSTGPSLLCVHPAMPLYDQGSTQLLNYVNAQGHWNLGHDPGWCGPTAVSMVGKTVSNELASLIGSSPSYNNGDSSLRPTLLNQVTGSLYDTTDSTGSNIIWNAMHALDTDITGGGTYPTPVTANFKSLMGNVSGSLDYVTLVGGALGSVDSVNSKLSDSSFLVKHNPIGLLVISCDKSVLSTSKSGHYLAINGYEGKWNRVYDPWGTVYSINPGSKISFAGVVNLSSSSNNGSTSNNSSSSAPPGSTPKLSTPGGGGDLVATCGGQAYVHYSWVLSDYTNLPIVTYVAGAPQDTPPQPSNVGNSNSGSGSNSSTPPSTIGKQKNETYY